MSINILYTNDGGDVTDDQIAPNGIIRRALNRDRNQTAPLSREAVVESSS